MTDTGPVAQAVGEALVEAGVRRTFGVVGSGNFHVTNAMVAAGATYVAARHEGGAATMADAYARVTGEVAVVSLHQGCGLTNALTGITEAAKSRTPLLVLAAATAADATLSNFRIDQDAVTTAVGAVPAWITSPATAVDEALEALRRARDESCTVVLHLPLDIQGAPQDQHRTSSPPQRRRHVPTAPGDADVAALAALLRRAERPVLIAGRGARHAGGELRELGATSGALLATSAVAKGLFRGDDFDLDISGGFSTPVAAELIGEADVVVAFGCALNMWTTRHGRLVADTSHLVQVDLDPSALGRHRPVQLGIVGDTAATATAVTAALRADPPANGEGYRTARVAARLATGGRWRDEPYDDWGTATTIDPRTLTIALDDLLPAERIVSTDSGNFMGYPAMFLDVPDEHGFCFTQAYQSVGLGLATAIGAALARPDRLAVAALGDGGLTMGASELDTVVRLGLDLVAVVYDDGGYGAEIHHFGPDADLDAVRFPPTDHAAIARGYGFEAITVRTPADLAPVADWVAGPRDRPLLVDAKVAADRGAWWLEEAFRGH